MLLVIDEVGCLPLQTVAAAALLQIITQGYLKSSVVMTTNSGDVSWGKSSTTRGSPWPCSIACRFRSVVFNIDGKTFRTRSHRARSEFCNGDGGRLAAR